MDGIEKIKKITSLNQELKKENKNNNDFLKHVNKIDLYKNTGFFYWLSFYSVPFFVLGLFSFFYYFDFLRLNFFIQFGSLFATIITFLILFFVTLSGFDRIIEYKKSLKYLHKNKIKDYKKEKEENKINIENKTEQFNSLLKNINLNDYKYAIENCESLESDEFNYLESLFKDYRSHSFECRSASLKNQLRIELSDEFNVELENY